jgi:hypothetical protein
MKPCMFIGSMSTYMFTGSMDTYIGGSRIIKIKNKLHMNLAAAGINSMSKMRNIGNRNY